MSVINLNLRVQKTFCFNLNLLSNLDPYHCPPDLEMPWQEVRDQAPPGWSSLVFGLLAPDPELLQLFQWALTASLFL